MPCEDNEIIFASFVLLAWQKNLLLLSWKARTAVISRCLPNIGITRNKDEASQFEIKTRRESRYVM